MVDVVNAASEGGKTSQKMTFSSMLATWFPFLGSSIAQKRKIVQRNFSFKRKSVDMAITEDSVNAVPPLTVVSFKGNNNEQARPASERKSIKQRSSSRRFKGISRGKSQKFEITEDMMNLQRIIIDNAYRQKLIELLIPLDGDSSVKVRFCCAVEEYQREKDKKTKRKKAAQIVKMFVRKGSMFRLKGLSKEHEKSLKAKKYDTLDALKNVILDELVANQLVAKTMREILASELMMKDKEALTDEQMSDSTDDAR